jgi:hypothetical protein
MKNFVTLNALYCGFRFAAILPYVFELLRLTLLINYVNYFGCENWWIICVEERKQRVYENMVLKRVLWPRRDEVTEEWSRLHNEELYDLYCSPNFIRSIKLRRITWARRVARVSERGSAYRILVGKLDGKRALRRPKRKWEYNIEMDGAWTGMV